MEDFVLKLVSLLLKLRTHHFLSKVQAAHYKSLKEQLGNSDCLVTLDFAENYTFESQDEVQGAHWTNNQATVHPIVIYYKENDELISKSFCIISNSPLLKCYLEIVQCKSTTSVVFLPITF